MTVMFHIVLLLCQLFFANLLQWCCSRSVGYRFGPHLGDTVPVLISYCTSASENDEELREYSLQVLPISCCPAYTHIHSFLFSVLFC